MAKLGARNRVEIALWTYETNRIDTRAPTAPIPTAPSRPHPTRRCDIY
jgi:hypothetical protein